MHPQGKPWRKLYLARHSKNRTLHNQAKLERMLIKQGFEIVEPSTMTLQEQVDLFSEAAMVVAPSGATLTNMIFCPPSTKIIIIMPNHEATNYYFWTNLGAMNNLNITILTGKRLFKRIGYYSIHDDFTVDTNLVLHEL